MKAFKSQFTLGLALTCAAITLSLAMCAQAQTLSYLAVFSGTNGSGPSTVIEATDGNFYAATANGGTHSYGNVVRITPSGEITSLYDFCSEPHCSDGAYPLTPPILGSDGNLYGVTWGGGSDLNNGSGWGTVYKMTLSGQITTLYTFCTADPCLDGANPDGIMQGADGNLYGVTVQIGEFGYGTLFEVTTTGKFSVVHTFCSLANCADGSAPSTTPIQGINGSLYGATQGGGTYGGGIIYALSPTGDFSVVRPFGTKVGGGPNSLVEDAKGDLFGTTLWGGGYGEGNVFEINFKQKYKVLHSFTYGPQSGLVTGLTLANDGNLYGTTQGIDGFGTIFEITPEGAYTQLYHFDCCNGSSDPYGLVQAPNGAFYGPVAYYGIHSNGAIYSLDEGLSPLVRTVPTMGKVGTNVTILGSKLTGSTSVTFNGVAAAFTVESDTYIKATVPKGAASGTVSVDTPSGTLNSNPQFVVTK